MLKITKHIAFFYVENRLTYLNKIIKETNSGGETLIIEYHNNGYGNKKLGKSIDKNGNWYIIEYSITGEIISSYDNLGNHSNF
jgi:hypothetical protein